MGWGLYCEIHFIDLNIVSCCPYGGLCDLFIALKAYYYCDARVGVGVGLIYEVIAFAIIIIPE